MKITRQIEGCSWHCLEPVCECQGLLFWLITGGSKSVQELFDSIEEVLVLTSIILT